VGAALANHLTGKFASEVLLDCMLGWTTLDSSLDAIHEHVEELLDVHLLKYVRWVALPVLEGMAESFRVDVLLLRFLKPSEQQLKLVKHALIRVCLCHGVLHAEDVVS